MTEQQPEPTTIGEINITLNHMKDTMVKMENKMDAFIANFLPVSVFVMFKEDNEKRINALEDNQKWVVRTILGIVITAIISLVVINK